MNNQDKEGGNNAYPDGMQPHLSDRQAAAEIKAHADRDIDALIEALNMKSPVSRSRMTELIETLVKETIIDDAEATERAMRDKGWEADLGAGESLRSLALRLTAYLSHEPGVHLLNQFTHSIAKTTGRMY